MLGIVVVGFILGGVALVAIILKNRKEDAAVPAPVKVAPAPVVVAKDEVPPAA